MEVAIILVLVFIVWTNETLVPKKKPENKSVEEKLADAIKDYLKEGIKVRCESGEKK